MNFNLFMWIIESCLGISIFFNSLLPTIGWYPLTYAYLPHFPHTKNRAFQHTFYATREIAHMWCFSIPTSTIKYRIVKTSHCFAFEIFEKGRNILTTLDKKKTSLSVLKRKQLKTNWMSRINSLLFMHVVVWKLHNVAPLIADPFQCNYSNRQNPPIELNHCYFRTNDAVSICFQI